MSLMFQRIKVCLPLTDKESVLHILYNSRVDKSFQITQADVLIRMHSSFRINLSFLGRDDEYRSMHGRVYCVCLWRWS